MSLEFMEITDISYVPECVEVHKKIFNFSDLDAFPPAYFSILIRKEHPLGVVIGCFNKTEDNKQLIGLSVTMADPGTNALYSNFIGISPDFQNGRCGYLLALKLREIAIKKGFKMLYGIFDPLKPNLGKLYTRIGVKVTQYIPSPYVLHQTINIPDKVMFEWDWDSEYVRKKLSDGQNLKLPDYLEKYPIINNTFSELPAFLIEIPDLDYLENIGADLNKAIIWQKSVIEMLKVYLNQKKYEITECISGKIEGIRKVFYLFSKQ